MSDGCVGSAKMLKVAQNGVNVYQSVYPVFYQKRENGETDGETKTRKRQRWGNIR